MAAVISLYLEDVLISLIKNIKFKNCKSLSKDKEYNKAIILFLLNFYFYYSVRKKDDRYNWLY